MLSAKGNDLYWKPTIVGADGSTVDSASFGIRSADGSAEVTQFLATVAARGGDQRASLLKATNDVLASIDGLVGNLRATRSRAEVGSVQPHLEKAVTLSKQLQVALSSLRPT